MLTARRPLLKSFGLVIASAGCADEQLPNEPGAKAPGFQLEDFQPASAGATPVSAAPAS
jgi:hypothetical protein